MSDLPDELAALEAELSDAGQLVCPACRLEQSIDHDQCERCGAELGLLSHARREARDRRLALYDAILRCDTVGALGHLDAIVQLTGPSVELAVLRKLIRHGTVPLEVVGDLLGGDLVDEELAGVYTAAEADDAPAPPDDEAAAYEELVGESDPALEESEEVDAEPDEPPSGSAEVAVEAPAASAPGDNRWGLPLLAVCVALGIGVAIGRLTNPAPPPPPPPPAVESRQVEWEMAPLPEPPPDTSPTVEEAPEVAATDEASEAPTAGEPPAPPATSPTVP